MFQINIYVIKNIDYLIIKNELKHDKKTWKYIIYTGSLHQADVLLLMFITTVSTLYCIDNKGFNLLK